MPPLRLTVIGPDRDLYRDHETVHVPGDGPHDVEDLDPEVTLAAGTVDFGAVQVPVPVNGTVTVEPSEKGRMQAVHVAVPEGRLSVSALAAPRSSRLWPDLVAEIDASLREGGARVRSFQGTWGRELHATSGAATSVFVGVDGARWMLYGVATGPTRDAPALDEQLRRMMRGTVVVRGRSPYPVRTVLPLEVPEHLVVAPAPPPPPVEAEEGAVVQFRRPGHRAAPTGAFPAEQAPPPARPVEITPATAALPLAVEMSSVTTVLPRYGGRPVLPAAEISPPTTALPAYEPRAIAAADATSALPLGRPDDPPAWSDPVHRIADPGGPVPLDAGPDPDDRPTEVRPGRLLWPTEPAHPGGAETAPWALDPPAVPDAGGRRRLREPDAGQNGHGQVSPGLTAPWAAWPTGSRPPVLGLTHVGPTHDGPTRDMAPTDVMAVVPDVLRLGRHAAPDARPGPAARGAETRPWAQERGVSTDPVTEPLPVVRRPAPGRPSGRHHRPD